MDLVRKLAWAALLVGSGAPSADPPVPAVPAAAPVQNPKPQAPPAPETAQPPAPWPRDWEDDDEFEGEGWTFWPLSGRRD